jgi:hypothetical protein
MCGETDVFSVRVVDKERRQAFGIGDLSDTNRESRTQRQHTHTHIATDLLLVEDQPESFASQHCNRSMDSSPLHRHSNLSRLHKTISTTTTTTTTYTIIRYQPVERV